MPRLLHRARAAEDNLRGELPFLEQVTTTRSASATSGRRQRAARRDTLRITAQLVRTLDGSHVWSQRYDRKQTDLFAIQDEIAGAVTAALVGALVPEAKAAIAVGGTANLSAFDDYTRGLQQMWHFSFESLPQAEQLFQQALGKDPKYVDAMVALLTSHSRVPCGAGL